VASVFRVEPEALTADALDLVDAQIPLASPMAAPPAADPVSEGACALLRAHADALATVVGHSGTLRTHGGETLAQTAAILEAADRHSAAAINAVADGPLPPSAPSVPAVPASAAPPAVMLPEIPAMALPPTLPGDQFSALIHGGRGSSPLLDFSDAWRAHARGLDDLAERVVSRGDAIDEHWVDAGNQHAGTNTRDHGYWLRESADRARIIAATAETVADHFVAARRATPTPEEFDDAKREYLAAYARRDPIGVAQAAQQYATLEARAVDAATSYSRDVSSATNRLAPPLQTAPAIALAGVDGPPDRNNPTVQAVDFHGGPLPERPKLPKPEPDPPPGGWSDDPITRAAQKIAYGHAYTDHPEDFARQGISKDQLAQTIEKMMRESRNPGDLVVGRTPDGAPAIYDPKTNLIVIRDPGAADDGTAFRPKAGEAYIDRKMPTRLPSLSPSEFGDTAPQPAPVEPKSPVPAPRAGPGGIGGGPLPDETLPHIVELPHQGEEELPVIGDGKADVPEA
jgi:hypothetical protein